MVLSHQLAQLWFCMYFVLQNQAGYIWGQYLLHIQHCHIKTNGVEKKNQMGHSVYIGQIVLHSLTFAKP